MTSYGFSHFHQLELFNTSSVPLSFRLKCCSPDSEDSLDFTITPQVGYIKEFSSVKITLQFNPRAIRTYACEIVVDVDNVGDDILRLPVIAESLVPTVTFV
jgi:hydrocephalus-inducing protein